MEDNTNVVGKRTPTFKGRSANSNKMSFYKGREIYRTAKPRIKNRGYAVDRLLLVYRIACPECHYMHTVMQEADGSISILCPAVQSADSKKGTVFSLQETDLSTHDMQFIAYHTVDLYDQNGEPEKRIKEFIPIDELGFPVSPDSQE